MHLHLQFFFTICISRSVVPCSELFLRFSLNSLMYEWMSRIQSRLIWLCHHVSVSQSLTSLDCVRRFSCTWPVFSSPRLHEKWLFQGQRSLIFCVVDLWGVSDKVVKKSFYWTWTGHFMSIHYARIGSEINDQGMSLTFLVLNKQNVLLKIGVSDLSRETQRERKHFQESFIPKYRRTL